MPLTPQEWHARFQIQADWTESIRRYILNRINIPDKARILELGSGTGVILNEVYKYLIQSKNNLERKSLVRSNFFGLDINRTFLTISDSLQPGTSFVEGDALCLPYEDDSFAVSYCHFLLMWITKPVLAVLEMHRVTKPGCMVIAFAEPDYGGRIDFPPDLEELGKLQTQALTAQGADPYIGRKLASIFLSAGLIEVQVGVLGGNWEISGGDNLTENEWKIARSDLESSVSSEEINRFEEIARNANEEGIRTLFVPTFYALGYAP